MLSYVGSIWVRLSFMSDIKMHYKQNNAPLVNEFFLNASIKLKSRGNFANFWE